LTVCIRRHRGRRQATPSTRARASACAPCWRRRLRPPSSIAFVQKAQHW